MRIILIVLFALFCLNAFATNPQILARSEVRKSFGLDSLSIFYDSYPVLSRDNKLYINMNYIESGNYGLHQFDLETGENQSLFQLNANFRVSPVLLLGTQHAIVSVYDDKKTYGVLSIDTMSGSYRELFKVNEDQSVQMNSLFLRDNQLFFRYQSRSSGKQGLGYIDQNMAFTDLPSLKSSVQSYSFSPCANSFGEFAFKERFSTNGDLSEEVGDQLVFVDVSGKKNVILVDQDMDSKSKIKKIYNQCHINDQAEIYQVVEYEKAVHAIIRYKDGEWKELARDGKGDIGQIEYFAVSSNDLGEYAFRALDSQSRQAIFLFDKFSRMILKIKKGDQLATESGFGVISHIQDTAPSFAGRPALSNYGLAFNAFLVTPDKKKSLGHALYYYHLRTMN
ncbi:MAG: hypothetical protein VX642_07445 [Bdellovibrionota bacterium]|nr:hypothetical protein [Bdellovibrionota bacterium]